MGMDNQRAGCRPSRERAPAAPSRLWTRCWSAMVAVTVLVGWLCAVGEWGWQPPVSCALGLGSMVLMVGVVAWWGTDLFAAVGAALGAAVLAGPLTVAAVGVVSALGALGTVTVLTLALSHPVLVSRAGPALSRWRAGALDADASRLTDEALWQAWRRSHVQLTGTSSVAVRAGLVQQREEYLDELLRRHPHAVTSWSASGPGH